MLGYLRYQKKLLASLCVFTAVFLLLSFLYGGHVEPVLYASALCGVFCAALTAFDYVRFRRKRAMLQRMAQYPADALLEFDAPENALEDAYQQLLVLFSGQRVQAMAEREKRHRETLDYFTLWVHQIKTPISAAALLLQNESHSERGALSAELFKIERYVDMALSYLRLDSETTDFLFRRTALDDILRGAVRKYANLFILKKISLDFRDTGMEVLTDEKWLSLVIEQILSNAIKYTPSGGQIKIMRDGTALLIADNGIGIRAEDLPRIFEKGFTGYNGRSGHKSTGIGLYLCRRITDRLRHVINIQSRSGHGTRVYLYFYEQHPVIE